MNKDHVSRFDELAEKFTDDLDKNLKLTGTTSEFFYKKKVEIISSLLQKEDSKILDFGAGAGNLALLLKRLHPKLSVSIYEPAKNLQKIIHTRAQNEDLILDIITDSNMRTNYFDIVIAAGVFHHIPKEERLPSVKTIYQALNQNGIFLMFEHNPWNIATQIIVANAPVDKDAKLLNHGYAKRLAQSANFRSTNISFIHFLPPSFKPLLPLEKKIKWLPLGAQYYLTAQK